MLLLFLAAFLCALSAKAQNRSTSPRSEVAQGEMSAEAIFNRFASRVLLLECNSSLASGVLVSSDGLIVTNAHVVKGCPDMTATRIEGPSRRSYATMLKYFDEKSDIAVLQIANQGLDFFEILTRPVRSGERVYAIGNPSGLEQTITEGIVSGNRQLDGRVLIQHSASISPGSSGGALISSRGELLGINELFLKESQNLNFAVPASALAGAVSNARDLTGSLRFPGPPQGSLTQVPPPMPPAANSEPPSAENPPNPAVQLVRLNVTVLDKSGKLINNLPQSAFTVLENGAPQQINIFKWEEVVPVSMGIVIDSSGDMRDKRQSVVTAALALANESNRQDEVFVVNFNDEAYLDTDFTNDPKILEQGLTRIDSRGGTAMRDAIRMSIDHLKEKGKRDKKVILVVTDGNDNSSNYSLDALVRLAQQDDVVVYAIGLQSQEKTKDAGAARISLNLLAESTGGQAFYPKNVSEAERAAREAGRAIRNQYTIAYKPTNMALDGSFRQIKITVKAGEDSTVRVRQGYYAPKGRQ
jgi:VWFA-related protein